MSATCRRSHSLSLAAVLLGVGFLVAIGCAAAQAPGVSSLDRFETIVPWRTAVSDGVHASLSAAQGPAGPALRIDFDLGGTAGYAAAQRNLALDLPANYEIGFELRGDAPVNEFQVKLADGSGENVWWYDVKNFVFPRGWRHIRIKKRQIEFAWGPTKDRTLARAATIEFVVNAGRGGGSGSIYVSDLTLRELPVETGPPPAPSAQASSSLPGAGPAEALDGRLETAWKSDPAGGKLQTFTIDLRHRREFGGLVLRWRPNAFASRYDVLFSDDGEHWETVKNVVDGSGGPDALALPESETRFVRFIFSGGPAPGYELAEVEVKELAFGATRNGFIAAVARESPRGTYPRGFTAEQSYWTIVGVDGGARSGLLSEDGALEARAGGFSIEPFVVDGSRVYTWADAEHRHALVDGFLPMPSVTWESSRWTLAITAFAEGDRERSGLVARYELANRSSEPLELTLALAVRPYQVNPPAQFLNTAGGASPIHDLTWDGAAFDIDGRMSVYAAPAPDRIGAFSLGAGPVPRILAADWTEVHSVHDWEGWASGVLVYRFTLGPGERQSIGLVVPLSGRAQAPPGDARRDGRWLDAREADAAATWRRKLDRIRLRVPPPAQPLADTLRTSLAHLLLTRNGPVLRPGTRSYSRSWIRDGTMISEVLLRVGHADVAKEYLRWYAPHQFANGKIPCCIDNRGADPVPENDSPGEFLFLVAEIFRYTGDRTLLEEMWPHVAAAAGYLESLRQSGRAPASPAPASRALYGLLPASISHEGYSAKPMHSYWDDFWALKGYDAAQTIAQALGRSADALAFSRQRDEFARDLRASILAATAAHGIDYLPGSAELGDFDPTSTSIAFAPHGQPHDLPQRLVRATYERYWREFVARRDGRAAWDDYTPYELRNVATFVRLGWRDRAQALLAFFLEGRRPAAWNQWAEVVGREPRTPRFVGDMPHAWVASDFIRSMLDLFLYERIADHALVLAAGVPASWIDREGVAVEGLHTPYGTVSYTLRQDASRVLLDVALDPASTPRIAPGGLVFAWPFERPPGATHINGRPARWHNGELLVRELPARITVQR